jgi:biotin carboxyl carrier protein
MRTFRVSVSGKTYVIEVDDVDKSPMQITVNGRAYEIEIEWEGATSEATVRPEIVPVAPAREAVEPAGRLPTQPPKPRVSDEERSSALTIDAPMPGTIVAVHVRPGAKVARGEEVCVLEAMKMRNSIRSPRDGEVDDVLVAPGTKVAYGNPLIRFAEPAPTGSAAP